MNAKELFEDIRSYCQANASEKIVKKYSRYFKEGYDAYGLTREHTEGKVKSLMEDKSVNMNLVLETSRLLVKTGKYEETSFAILLLMQFSEHFSKETLIEIGKWFEIGITNWAHTDVICGYFFPVLFGKNIIFLNDIAEWRNAKNKYQRRAVPVAMLNLLKTTNDYSSLFNFIDPIMMDPERVVHQGLGWFLREVWKLKRDVTEEFLLKWKDKAPRLIFQYATEKMTKEEKQKFKKEK